MAEPLKGSDRVFKRSGHLGLELRRRRAREARRDRHGWKIKIREVLNLHHLEAVESAKGQ